MHFQRGEGPITPKKFRKMFNPILDGDGKLPSFFLITLLGENVWQ